MPLIPEFVSLLDRMKEIHKKKNDDYASDENPFFNFDIQADFIKMFEGAGAHHQAFANLIGLKLARLAQLLDKKQDKTPNNESIDDTFLDLCTYMGLWAAWYERNSVKGLIIKGNRIVNKDELKKEAQLTARETGRKIYEEAREKLSSLIPRLCSLCALEHDKTQNWISHAVVMHSAILNKTQGTLKFPSGILVIIPPATMTEDFYDDIPL